MRTIKCPSCGAGVVLENQHIATAEGESGAVLTSCVECAYCGSVLTADVVYAMFDLNARENANTPAKVGRVLGSVANIVGNVTGPIFNGNFQGPIIIK